YGRPPNGEVVWVIGDTPKDVACARPYRAKALAVATGEYNEHQLAKAQPDALMKDLREIRKFLRVIQN
ncbi:MAG: hydrolase, partial [Calditrichaeota bacterium]